MKSLVAMKSGTLELLSAQQKREFFDQIEELLRSSRHRRPKSEAVDKTSPRPPTSNETRRTTTESDAPEKERLPIEEEETTQRTTDEEEEAAVATMRDLKKLGALQQEKRPAERKPKGSAVKKAKRAASTASVDPNTQLLHDRRVLLIPYGPDMGRKRLEILKGLVNKLGGSEPEDEQQDWQWCSNKLE